MASIAAPAILVELVKGVIGALLEAPAEDGQTPKPQRPLSASGRLALVAVAILGGWGAAYWGARDATRAGARAEMEQVIREHVAPQLARMDRRLSHLNGVVSVLIGRPWPREEDDEPAPDELPANLRDGRSRFERDPVTVAVEGAR